MILITGAAGKTGRAILQAVMKKETAVRAWVRTAEQAAAIKSEGVTDVVVGDVMETAVWQQATTNVRAIYHICPNLHANEVEIGHLAIEAARTNQCHHFVYHSVLHPQTHAMPHHWAKSRVEDALLASGLPFTILQPSAYMQNVLAQRETIVEQGVYTVPYALNSRLSMVDLLDVAAVAATVLTAPGHAGATYELAGSEALTQTAVAQLLSSHLAQQIRPAQISHDNWKKQAERAGLGVFQIETLLNMFTYYAKHGLIGNDNVLGWLLGRNPTRFSQFINREF
ncbi:MAG: NmrA family NAD(P)-binding protein [Chloroflexi bacterium]|nr:NmrA family NAD(P)-binding protein [Chloroflexota bacterium]